MFGSKHWADSNLRMNLIQAANFYAQISNLITRTDRRRIYGKGDLLNVFQIHLFGSERCQELIVVPVDVHVADLKRCTFAFRILDFKDHAFGFLRIDPKNDFLFFGEINALPLFLGIKLKNEPGISICRGHVKMEPKKIFRQLLNIAMI